ncbi:phosphate/phosphite/phosphonate ABC transporter substrate-binding protein [bacterium]|nr:phosphate/phosphite/phosphonate ABC transporter substrate-binding protein [bacterium]
MMKFRGIVLCIFFLALGAFVPVGAEAAPSEELSELRIVFQKQKDPARIRQEAAKVGAFLSEELKMPVRTQVPGSYAAAVQALVSRKADVAYVDSLAYLLAKRDGGAKVLLAEERMDAAGKYRTEYDSIFVVRKESPLKSFQDVLEQHRDLRMVFTSPTSTSGFVMAYRRLVREGVLSAGENAKSAFRSVHYGGGYAQALEEVLLKRADICAVSYYTMEGDSANRYLPKEKREQLRILERTPGVPTHVVIARAGLSAALEQQIRDAILKLSKESPKLLTDVYGTARFVEVDGDRHVQSAREAMEYLPIPLTDIVHKKVSLPS